MLIMPLLLLCACAPRITPYQVTEPMNLRAGVYHCPGDYEFAVRYQGQDVLLSLPGREVLLSRVTAASGSKFSNGDVTFWTKGEQALLETPAQAYSNCTISKDDDGIAQSEENHPQFFAAGQDPAWTLEITPIRMILSTDWGRERYVFAAPFIDRDPDPGRTLYRVESSGAEATVVITDNDCRNALEDTTHEKSVIVTLDGRTFAGCGGKP